MLFAERIHFYSQMLRSIINRLVNFALPPICLFCGFISGSPRLICQACEKDLPILSHHCLQCAQIIPEPAERCGSCLQEPPPFDLTFALYQYKPPLVKLITSLKFEANLAHANLLADLLLRQINHHWYHEKRLPDLLIPVPLHPERLKKRGFNQALEIARPLAKALGIPIDKYGLKRTKATAAQSSLRKKDRTANMRNAFTACRSYQGLTVAVIDDVMTTGQTLYALSATLKKAGAEHIHLWCCARTAL